ncbi:hypothetical protein PsAD2_00569 [Pseudovibrio axinellae]|uniref:DUF2007 domain-containing protein n=1 Tax=Pseudovibrio axinellae TaxID=989403 RepID=A0A166ALL9_9HYPH|nr:DUF2007 domain-containing protein [Pseudovibrio axinellae]KZL21278.1 hypothetical protein PsAD2_00569 [Pseudovibrio axinellae]SEQ94518.1 Putative signal transducing protein [Pseudovibrio axinellae]
MEELIRTTDPVVISHIEALLGDTDILYFVADTNMSILDGSLGFLPRRIMVASDRLNDACELMKEAGLEHYLKET